MNKLSFEELLDAGVHFGHLKRKWNPAMAPYIFMERNGIHIIDLYKTIAKAEEAAAALNQIAKSGKKILFVATKKQAKEIVAELVKRVGMPYVTERWPGGMLTNFATIRKAVRKMASIDKMKNDNTFVKISKRERLQIIRERAKLEKNLGSIADLTRLPSAIFIVDILKEKIAVNEAKKLNIPTFAIVDTNSNPNEVDYPIPANDDASKSITLILSMMISAIEEGIAERKVTKDKQEEEEETDEIIIEKASLKTIEEQEEEEEAKKLKKAALKKDIGTKAPETEDKEAGNDIKKVRKPMDKNVKKPAPGKKNISKK
ncbi:MAG: 30S ribosomal protein S2 [Bacteroidales bacterium]|jgi:small subunit ribosomal protein S2|nr:30S ribosomal protein S2 [Bacteroidales bacterium]MDD4213762.1 30S ribosomal protein S2 [Bacteroidales bacterium]